MILGNRLAYISAAVRLLLLAWRAVAPNHKHSPTLCLATVLTHHRFLAGGTRKAPVNFHAVFAAQHAAAQAERTQSREAARARAGATAAAARAYVAPTDKRRDELRTAVRHTLGADK